MKRRSAVAEADLHAYVDGELQLSLKTAVETHLAAAPDDAARVAQWRAQSAFLHDTFDGVLSEPVPLRLSPSRLAGRRFTRRPRLAAIASLAFAAGLGCGGLAVIGLLSVDRRPVPATAVGQDTLAARALAAHRTFVVEVRHPVEVGAADEAHLVQWLSKRLDYAIRLPDLRPEGYRLLGGRLLAGENGPAALFMFESDKGERLTLYCTRAGKQRQTAFRYAESAGSAAFYWIDGTAAYALSGPADRDRLMRVAKRVYEMLDGGKAPT